MRKSYNWTFDHIMRYAIALPGRLRFSLWKLRCCIVPVPAEWALPAQVNSIAIDGTFVLQIGDVAYLETGIRKPGCITTENSRWTSISIIHILISLLLHLCCSILWHLVLSSVLKMLFWLHACFHYCLVKSQKHRLVITSCNMQLSIILALYTLFVVCVPTV